MTVIEMRKQWGDNILIVLRNIKMSIAELASHLNIELSNLSATLKGSRQTSIKIYFRIVDITGAHPREIFNIP